MVPALLTNKIMPNKLNILHWLAYYNNHEGLEEALKENVEWLDDKNDNSPLEFALKRGCIKSYNILLDYVVNVDSKKIE
jgi:ankyrin repeat protein